MQPDFQQPRNYRHHFQMLYLQVGRDERPDDGRANASVDTRSVRLSAALTPGNKTDQSLGGVDNGASRVTLA
jgi:hypothetical protein